MSRLNKEKLSLLQTTYNRGGLPVNRKWQPQTSSDPLIKNLLKRGYLEYRLARMPHGKRTNQTYLDVTEKALPFIKIDNSMSVETDEE